MLERLKTFFETTLDIDIDINLLNFNRIVISGEETGEKVSIGEDEVAVNIPELEKAEREELGEIVDAQWEEKEEVVAEDAFNDKEAIEEANRDRISETLDFFRGKISERHFAILRASLYLREAIERDDHITKMHIEARKRDIAENYGTEAYAIASLCTAGYFDQGRYLRVLYHQVERADEVEEDYADVFGQIIQNQPFTVFVSTHQSEYQIEALIKEKLSQYQRYGVAMDFVDVRGIGNTNHATIEAAMENLEDSLDNVEYEIGFREDEMIVRIDPDSINGL